MKTNRMFGCLVLTVTDSRLAWGQNRLYGTGEPIDPPQLRSDSYGGESAIGRELGVRSIGRTNRRSQANNTDAEYRKAIKKLQAASSEEEKAGAMAELSTLLDRYFTADMKNREKNIVDLEARVQKLRAQLEKRQAAKEKIIKLQLQVLSNEAEGLGFFGQTNRSRYSAWQQTQPHRQPSQSNPPGPPPGPSQ